MLQKTVTVAEIDNTWSDIKNEWKCYMQCDGNRFEEKQLWTASKSGIW